MKKKLLLQEQWDLYMDVLKKRADVFMDSLNIKSPDVFYRVGFNGKLEECFITERYYGFYLYPNGKKPTKQEVEKIKLISESEYDFKSEKAYFNYFHYWGSKDNGEQYKSSSAIKIIDIDKPGIYLDKKVAEELSEKASKDYEERKAFKELHKKDANYDYKGNGYSFLGWQNGWKHVYFDEHGNETTDRTKSRTFGYSKNDYPVYGACRELKHETIEVIHNQRGSENTVSCPICKIYWKYDSSD